MSPARRRDENSQGSRTKTGCSGAQEVLRAASMIPDERKQSLLKAQELGVIWAEVGPDRSLEYCEHNFWGAAEALVDYWEEREKLFGKRAFLPMYQTGNAALTMEDIITLQTGKFALLRKTTKGQEVMFVDRSRVLPTSTTVSKLRALFYMVTQLAKADRAQTLGCHVIVLLVTPRNSQLDVDFVRGAMKVLNKLPVKIFLHMLVCTAKFGMTPIVQSVVTAGVSHGLSNVHGLQVHSKAVGEPIINELKDLGLTRVDYPSSIGGTWKYESHTFWCRTKAAEEISAEDSALPRTKKRKTGGSDEDMKRERAKSLNVIHSRLKRERRKAEENQLQETCDTLYAKSDLLKKENSFLTNSAKLKT